MNADFKQPNPRAGKITFFRAADAKELDGETMVVEPLNEQDMAGFTSVADGSVLKLLFKDEATKMSLTYIWFKANYMLPPHSHNADCLYYVISGEAHMGKRVMKAGDGFLIPSDVDYTYRAGPEGVEILEFRTSTFFDFKFRTGDSFWTQMAGILAANHETWRTATPPLAAKRVLGAE